jgi:putative peptidoglycan lipid II flippase
MAKLPQKAGSRISLGNAATVLVVVALLGQALGFLRNRLISTNFTVHDPGSSDAFFVAFQIPDFFYYAIAGGAIGVALIPFLSDKIERGDKKGLWEITNSLLNLLTVVMLGFSVAMMVFAPQLVHLLAPNLPADHSEEAVTIMRFISFSPLFFALSGILTGVQQAYGRFFFYAIAPLIYNASIIASVFFFRGNIGVIGLGVGALVGAVLQLLVVRLGLFGLGFKYSPKILWRKDDFKGVLRQLPPRSLDQGIDQVNSIVEVNRAQALGVGPVSWYNFALTLHYVPIILIGNSISTAAFPRLTERLSQGRPDLFRRDFRMVLRVLVWITLPVVVVGYFARGYLARLIFGDVAPEVSLIFGFLTIAILFRIIYSMFSRYFYAHKDTITPLLVSIFAIGLNIYLAFKLTRPESYGITGLALAQSIVAASEVVILFIFMIYKDHKVFADKSFWGALLKTFSVTGFSVLTAFIMVSLLPLKISDRGFVTLGVKFGAIAGVTLLVHLVMSLLFGLKEPRPVLQKLRRLIVKPIKI